MARYRTEVLVGVISAAAGAIVGAFVTWSVSATVIMPAWLLGVLTAALVTAATFAAVSWRRIVRIKAVTFHPTKRVYYAASRSAPNPGPFCPKCYDVEGILVSLTDQKDGSHWCPNCVKSHYGAP